MKNVKKLKWRMLALCVAFCLVFVGCKNPTDSGTPDNNDTSAVETENQDSSAAQETPVDADVTVITAGSEITFNVGETKKVKAEGKTAAEFTETTGFSVTHKGNGIFEITAAETMTDATVAVNFNDGTDTDDGIDVTVNIYDPYYHLTLTLDDEVKAKAAAITVAYGGVTENTVSETVNAVYTAGQSTATAKLKKEYANEWEWFSPVKVTVKDSDGNEVVINQAVGYFCYSATEGNGYLENKTIAITAGVEELTFTITFEGFTAKAVSDVIYTKAENDFDADGENADAAEVSVAEGGASATFIVKKSYTNASGWFQVNFASVVVTDTSDNTVALSSGNTNEWFEYKDGMNTKLVYSAISTDDYTNALVTAVSLPNTINGTSLVLLKDDLTIPSDATAFKLVYTRGSEDIVNASSTWISLYPTSAWENETKLVNAWVSGFDASAETFTVYITESDAVAAFKAGNFYIAADSAGYTGTITITYAK